jgi:hypothetical protein
MGVMRGVVGIFAGHLVRLVQMRGFWLPLPLLFLSAFGGHIQVGNGTVEEFRTLYPSEWNVPYPAGIGYAIKSDRLFLLNEVNRGPSQNTPPTVVEITPYEDFVASVQLAVSVGDAVNLAYDNATDRLLLLNRKQTELSQFTFGKDGLVEDIDRFDVTQLGLNEAAGMDVDRSSRRLFILDRGTAQIVSADINHDYALVAQISLANLCNHDLRGMAVHPLSHHLFVVCPAKRMMYELTQSAQLVNKYDLSALEMVGSGGLVFAPSADLTDAPEVIHLYMADNNLTGDGVTDPRPVFGKIVEVALVAGESGGVCPVHLQDRWLTPLRAGNRSLGCGVGGGSTCLFCRPK